MEDKAIYARPRPNKLRLGRVLWLVFFTATLAFALGYTLGADFVPGLNSAGDLQAIAGDESPPRG